MINTDPKLTEARVQARKEFAELARIYSGRQKNDPQLRIAFAELQIEIEQSLADLETSEAREPIAV